MNNNCTLTEGPCDCGAWHTKEEIERLMAELQHSVLLENANNFGTPEFDEALDRDGHIVLLNKGKIVMVIPGSLEEIVKLMEDK